MFRIIMRISVYRQVLPSTMVTVAVLECVILRVPLHPFHTCDVLHLLYSWHVYESC